uniref:procollagen-proline 4-dioxygenase n=1 Tax=Cacopsylla melanoneura TaxID=428564 RepID=A0A8D8WZJ9_9HEMI
MLCFVKFLSLFLVVQTRWPSISAFDDSRTLFAALNSMIDTVHHENRLLKQVENYAARRTAKLKLIRSLHEKWEKFHRQDKDRLKLNKSDHKAKLKLIQRATRHWPKLKNDFLRKSQEHIDLDLFYKHTLRPDIKDLRGFARLLLVNAQIYNKTFEEILSVRSPFVTIDEFLELGLRIKQHLLGENPMDTLLKSSQVVLYGLNQYETSSKGLRLSTTRWDFLSSVTDELYDEGYWNIGYTICNAILKLFPEDDEFLFKVEIFRDRLTASKLKDRMDVRPRTNKSEVDLDEEEYARLCRRRELILSPSSNLKCYYAHKNRHLRHIAGYKVEEVSRSPMIRIYHDVLHDGEIELIKLFAFPLLTAAKVYDPNNEDSDISDSRISNNAWLLSPDDPNRVGQSEHQANLYRKLNQRMEDCTGLSKSGTEGLQVNNYGIGGHYLWHYDALYYNAHYDYYVNDRIATWMFYLNDVIEGGNTVFPRLNISVPPEKGAAVFWYNLLSTGENDHRTMHGGCPILQGTKWVTNMWISEFQQTFVKPCLPDRASTQQDSSLLRAWE